MEQHFSKIVLSRLSKKIIIAVFQTDLVLKLSSGEIMNYFYIFAVENKQKNLFLNLTDGVQGLLTEVHPWV